MRIVSAAAFALAIGLSGAALAGGSSAPFTGPVDPTLKTATKADIQGRVQRSCIATQAKLQSTDDASRFGRPCGCYASRTMRSLDGGEWDAYRSTGLFNESARAKALEALDRCNLPHPV